MSEFEVVRFLANMIIILQYLNSENYHNVQLRPTKIMIKKITPYKVRLSLNVQLASIDTNQESNNLYYSPETLTETIKDKDKQDSWSLGVLAYFMLESKLPFASVQEIKEKDPEPMRDKIS